MEKKRVKKGEKYWFVTIQWDGVRLGIETEQHRKVDDCLFKSNNYFATKEEAEVMAEKIRKVLEGAWVLTPPEGEIFGRKVEAVLNGAEVIEMPSEEEICDEAAIRYPSTWNGKTTSEGGYEIPQGFSAFIKAVEWIKSKIVK